jgi:CheY-like chemotaxis protein
MKHIATATFSPCPTRALPARALSILVAEDIEINRKLAEAFLTVGGHAVQFAGDGAEAVRMASENCFDLILMDVRMPVMDGFEATRRIRALASPTLSRVPIVAVTANREQNVRDACHAAGMDGFVTKPLTRDMLETVLSSVATVAH